MDFRSMFYVLIFNVEIILYIRNWKVPYLWQNKTKEITHMKTVRFGGVENIRANRPDLLIIDRN